MYLRKMQAWLVSPAQQQTVRRDSLLLPETATDSHDARGHEQEGGGNRRNGGVGGFGARCLGLFHFRGEGCCGRDQEDHREEHQHYGQLREFHGRFLLYLLSTPPSGESEVRRLGWVKSCNRQSHELYLRSSHRIFNLKLNREVFQNPELKLRD